MNLYQRKHHIKQTGFTLIELLITVAIVGILTVIVTGNYNSYGQKNRRTDAKTRLYEIMQREEKYMSENNTYTTNLTNLGFASSPLLSNGGYYMISAAASANGITDGVILTAVPQGSQVKDTSCGSFILNSNGTKSTSTGSANCW